MWLNFRGIDLIRDIINFHGCKRQMTQRIPQIIHLLNLLISYDRLNRGINIMYQQLLNYFVTYLDRVIWKSGHRLILSLILIKLIGGDRVQLWDGLLIFFILRVHWNSSSWGFGRKNLLYLRLFVDSIFKFFLFVIDSFQGWFLTILLEVNFKSSA